jgi:hypothetical protein
VPDCSIGSVAIGSVYASEHDRLIDAFPAFASNDRLTIQRPACRPPASWIPR